MTTPTSTRPAAISLAALSLALFATATAAAANRTVVLDDGAVRVVQHTLGPGESEPLTKFPCRVIYALNDQNQRLTAAGGTVQTLGHRFRSARFRPAEEHAITNPGTTALKELVVEIKGALPGVRGCEGPTLPRIERALDPLDPTRVATAYYKLIFENAAVRVFESNLKTSAATPAHRIGCRVNYALTEQVLETRRADGTIDAQAHPISSAWWRPAEELVLANGGTGNSFSLVLEFKHKPAGECPPPSTAAVTTQK